MYRVAALSFVIVVAVSLLTELSSPAAAQGACLSRSEQRQAVRTGEVIRPGRIARELGGKLLEMQLCRAGRRYVYRLRILDKSGHVRGHVVDAHNGRQIR